MRKGIKANAEGHQHKSTLAILAALAFSWTGPLAAAEDLPTVKLAEVSAGRAEIRRIFFGKAVARETVDLAFQVGGQIVAFPVQEGATVAKGSVVAQMDLEPFELAFEQARAKEEQAARTVVRFEQLAGSSVAETSLQDARTTLTLADIAVRNAERDLEHATLYAPFDSIVATRLVPNFSTVEAGTPVVRLHDMSELRIDIDVPEMLAQRVGSNPDISLQATFPASDESFPLELREFNAETAEIGQTYRITLGMPMPPDFEVLPGSSARVTATVRTRAQSIEVPGSAIVIGNDRQTYVMVFEPAGADQGRVTRTAVEIAPTNRGTVEIVAGLQASQEIVVSGAEQLDDGARVRRFTGFGD
ncbi:efflux RND transporter periplasmic adaptor subunit [Lutimaribacter marinistellae]|uniref:Efflux RND transporter periplasmic adaptor subunit n=1 Tax=Lutimaribacter marinistellae TaxID=1820329 RepID=A0ABV7TJ06_9RHOB